MLSQVQALLPTSVCNPSLIVHVLGEDSEHVVRGGCGESFIDESIILVSCKPSSAAVTCAPVYNSSPTALEGSLIKSLPFCFVCLFAF